MDLFRGFRLIGENNQYSKQFNSSVRRDDTGRIHAALYSDFFTGNSGQIMRSNYDYARFKDEIAATIEPYSPGEDIVIDIYEPAESDEFVRDAALLGFRRYVGACYAGSRKLYLRHMIAMLASLVIGLLVVYLMSLLPIADKPVIQYLLETIASVLVWQCVGYLAYNREGEARQMKRLGQMMQLEFTYKVWE